MGYQEIAITERTKRIKAAYLQLPVARETNPYVTKNTEDSVPATDG